MANNFQKLSKSIIKNSISNDWNIAKLEWNWLDQTYDESGDHDCLCGKRHIKNLCFIKNTNTKKQLIVGIECVKKFDTFDIDLNVLDAAYLLRKNIQSSCGKSVVEYMNENNMLSEWEYLFYINTVNKRKLSKKQLAKRVKVNNRFLNYIKIESLDQRKRLRKAYDLLYSKKIHSRKFNDIIKYYK